MKFIGEPIAIVGLSSLFPAAENLQVFWKNILYGVDAIKDVPDTHWKIEDYYDPNPEAEDKTYCKRGGFIPNTPFSPVEFGIPPNALDVIDVLQLLSLNVAKSTLFDAGYFSNDRYENIREKTGVVLGITGANSLTQPLSNRLQSPKLRQVLESRGLTEAQIEDVLESFKKAYAPWEENSFPGMLGNVVSGRIANRFNMGGINCTIDAACASSLAAMRMAIDELHSGRADMMLTGGCDAENTILMYMCFSKTPAFSKRGIISPFDEESDGTLIGEGMGVLALKRLSDAERDNDQIYAIIKGLGASSDGKFKSIYAPRKEGQIKCLERAYDDAGFSAQSVGIIEAHGTGTKVGDATEVSALKEILGKAPSPHIALGSVKSQIGHTKAAAGAAGIIKMALSLHHKILPPTLNIRKPTEELLKDGSPLYVNNQARPWFLNYEAEKRRGGVSSFGFGGTNFHAVLEEYTGAHRRAKRLHEVKQANVFGADTLDELKTILAEVKDTGLFNLDIPLVLGKKYRLGFVAQSGQEAQDKATIAIQSLQQFVGKETWHHPKGIYFSSRPAAKKVAALFSGQGSQYLNMSKHATMAYQQFHEMFEQADRILFNKCGDYLSNKIFPKPAYSDAEYNSQELVLRQTEFAQPAIGMVSAAAFKLLQKAGLKVDCVGGHSFGELTALWAASVITDEEFVRLAIARGDAMKPQEGQSDSGIMVAVAASGEKVQEILSGTQYQSVYLCNFNTYSQTVIGGAEDGVTEFSTLLRDKGIKTTQLPVSAAFHTPLVAHAQTSFAKEIDTTTFNTAKSPVYRNYDGKPVSSAEDLKSSLKQQLLEPVKFCDMVSQMLEDGVDTFIEFGPKGHLSKMVAEICKSENAQASVIAVDNGNADAAADQLNSALVQLLVAGVAVDSLGEFEPDYKDAPQKPGFKIDLNGINYVSDAHKSSWLESLENTPDIWSEKIPDVLPTQSPVMEMPAQAIEVSPNVSMTSAPIPEFSLSTSSEVTPTQAMDANILETVPAMEKTPVLEPSSDVGGTRSRLDLFNKLQKENSSLHETFLHQSSEVSHQTITLVGQISENSHASQSQLDTVTDLAKQGIQIVADSQARVSQSHQAYLKNTIDLAVAATRKNNSVITQFRPVPPQKVEDTTNEEVAAPVEKTDVHVETPFVTTEEQDSVVNAPVIIPVSAVVPEPAPITAEDSAPANSGQLSQENVTDIVLNIVSEKTGYPADVLDPEMDIEADLGIDSIKRVEILGALQKQLNADMQVDPSQASEIKTLADLAQLIGAQKQSAVTSTQAPVQIPAPAQSTAPQGVSVASVTQALLKVVSEKTGYPEDVLSVDMDMEADLGIDSIKRVEILGAMHKALPQAGHLQPETLAEVRTLDDIIQVVADQVETVVQTAPTQSVPTSTPSISAEKVKITFLEIVAEKTGYPIDVLGMQMSLESDLGIDSIKRVEILGELQKQLDFNESLDSREMAELNTLEDISSYIESCVSQGDQSIPAAPNIEAAQAPTTTNAIDIDRVQDSLLDIVSEKTGYPREVIELDMDLEADLGIDSIKRVEILGGLQSKHPELPAPDPSAAGELRNLKQIINFLGQDSQPSVVETSNESEGNTVKALSPIRQHAVSIKKIHPAEKLINCYQQGAKALVIADEKKQTQAIYDALVAEGFAVTLLVFPGVEVDEKNTHVVVENWKEQTLIEVLTALPEMDLVLYQHPQDGTEMTDISAKSHDVRMLKHLLLLSKYYKLSLNKPAEGRKAFVTLARMDGQLGLDEPKESFLAAGCFGLIKTLAVESENVFCRAIDIHANINEIDLAQYVVTELHDYNTSITDVGITSSGRYTFDVSPLHEQAPVEPLTEGTCFIVTGGARGITASCVESLAKGQKGKYLLVGRTPLEQEPQWAAGIEESQLKAKAAEFLKTSGEKPLPKIINSMVNQVIGAREIANTVSLLKNLGVQARYASVDISDASAVAKWFDTEVWIEKSDSLAILHGAGALADRLIEDKQLSDLTRVFSVKLYGLSNLLASIDQSKLKFVALFSSVAGLFGNVGQVDYAMANEILNRIVVKLRSVTPRTVSFIWGAWNAGMVTPEIKNIFESRGITLIEVDEGVKHFAEACLNPVVPELNMVGPSGGLSPRHVDFNSLKNIKRQVILTTNELLSSKLFRDHSIGGEAVLPATFAMGWVANVIENMFDSVLVTGCSRMSVKKGMVLTASLPESVELTLQGVGLSQQGHLLMDAVLSNTESGQTFYSFQGIDVGQQLTTMKDSKVREGAKSTTLTFYDDKTLFHGKGFQLLKSFQENDGGELVFTCQWLPKEHQHIVDSYSTTAYCPMYADALLQAALVWVKKYEGLPSLPMLIEDLRCHEPIQRGDVLYIRVKLAEQSDSQSSLYLSALTKDGHVHLAMRAGVIKSAALADKFSA